jgi:beta-glucosidase
VGGLFNIKSAQKIKKFKKYVRKNSKNSFNFAMDVIHGYETTFPIPLGLSCTWDMNLIERTGIAAQRVQMVLTGLFSMVDFSAIRAGEEVSEGSGEDPFWGVK